MLTATLLEDKVEYYGHNFPYSITVMNSNCMTGTDYGWHNTTKHNNMTTYSYVKISLGNDLAKQGNLVMPSSVSLSVYIPSNVSRDLCRQCGVENVGARVGRWRSHVWKLFYYY